MTDLGECGQYVALAVLGICALVQAKVNQRLNRRYWELHGELGRLYVKLGMVGSKRGEDR